MTCPSQRSGVGWADAEAAAAYAAIARLHSEILDLEAERDRYWQALVDIAGWESWQDGSWRGIAYDALGDDVVEIG